MAKMTLLDIVSEILSDMTSDPVNSISDTFESEQVAKIVRRVYFNLFDERVWPHTGQLFRLTPSTDSTRPTHMKIEDDVDDIQWVKYDISATSDRDYRDVKYLCPQDFIDFVMARDSGKAEVTTVIDYRGVPVFVINNADPTYYTSFDDEHLVFDSYDSNKGTTLMHSKTQVFGHVQPEWRMEDEFVPDMPNKAFGLLVNEAKSQSFIKLKEVFSQKDEQAATRQRSKLSRDKHRMDGATKYPDYGKPSAGIRKKYRNNNYIG